MNKKELNEELICANNMILKLQENMTLIMYENIETERQLKQGQDNYHKLWDMYSELKIENKALREYINETKDCGSCKLQRAIKTYDKRKINDTRN